jgi:hypothetical protein
LLFEKWENFCDLKGCSAILERLDTTIFVLTSDRAPIQ